ncbi:uncharacterized protein NPIL_462721 [Nephila pilipes]|uniref:Uncharacterized protein n=1 Tax=Nephila pilipes TaxID=299642 RepID=A0A8X6P2S0_NEPPI|nr:uncharacterized protein NPIL_462721 [Nephila pilipes]
MAAGIDGEYSEMVEMSTLSKTPTEVILNDRYASSEEIIPRRSFGQDSDIPGRIIKCWWLLFASGISRILLKNILKGSSGRISVNEQAQKLECLPTNHFPLNAQPYCTHFGVAILGILRVDGCSSSPSVPVVTVISGVIDAVVNVLSMTATLTQRPTLKELLHDISRIGRLTLFFIHLYGLVKVYGILPPEESDHSSHEFCDSLLFWIAFSFFHLTIMSSFILFLAMTMAALSYYF